MNIMETMDFICSADKDERRTNIRHVIASFGGRTAMQDNTHSRNIIVPAAVQKDKIVITAHYDNYPESRGYNDNGSGICTLLALYERNINDFPENVELVFTDLEEIGGIGAKEYVMKDRTGIYCNINIDVNGFGDLLFFENYGGFPFYLNRKYATPYNHVPFNDSYIFNRFNIPSILLISGNSERDMISDIWMLQHGGKKDNMIEILSEKPIMKTVEYIEKMII